MSIAAASSRLRSIPRTYYSNRSGSSLRNNSWAWSFKSRQTLATAASTPETEIPYRKQLKDEARQRRLTGASSQETLRETKKEKAKDWELTVGIEIHAQLNTERKLFSSKLLSFIHYLRMQD